MANYKDLAILNELKAELYSLSDQQLKHEAVMYYNLDPARFASISELREEMIAIEEKNYFK